jgi:hypothetical protein
VTTSNLPTLPPTSTDDVEFVTTELPTATTTDLPTSTTDSPTSTTDSPTTSPTSVIAPDVSVPTAVAGKQNLLQVYYLYFCIWLFFLFTFSSQVS